MRVLGVIGQGKGLAWLFSRGERAEGWLQNKKPAACAAGFLVCGGESGIRTRDTVSHIRTFQARSFNHSDTSPGCAPSPE
jgi:hypothetical protein